PARAVRCCGGRLLGRDARDGAHAVVGLEVDDAHAHGVAALGGDVVRVDADHLALGGDHEHVVARSHLQHADHVAVAARRLDVDDPLAAAPGESILVERCPLAVAALADGEDEGTFLHHLGGDDLVALLDLDASHAPRPPALGQDLLLAEANDHAPLGGDHHFAGPVGATGADHLVARLQVHGLDATGPDVGVGVELGLLHFSVERGQQHVASRGEIAHRDAGGHRLPLGQGEEVHHGLALGLPAAFGNLVDLEPMHLAAVGEEEQVAVGGGHAQVVHDVLFLGLHAHHALAAASPTPIRLDVRALDVAGARDGDHHLL